ncbi:bifunctional diguanylate cyclase/phosphodiesterase [Shewanella sp. FJAT-52076]|uniref:putative bifunctional diguanylate cyclase/phosphodiesterase n=1 Tax=Shewanella sp. FJAT-52076 TaxID=2864202 RepID=UPI001C65A5AC|nr:bifunctional diguanylate cyclase/phosphodiesterase [Shewanella sp. FJAT-52076]QYJ75955.1 bifunctional diguanylate cyclase/phosphodiesterase [Shewanella sp. FJAT-52076]
MNEIAQSRWYLSLRWKLLGAVFALMSILTLVLGTFAYRELGHQQAFLLESQQHALQQHLRRAVNQAVEDAVSSAHQVLLYAGPRVYAPQISHKDLNEQWPDMQLAWGMDAFGRIGSVSHSGFYLGRLPGDSEYKWFQRWSKASVPIWRIDCVERCLLQIQVPVLHNKESFRYYLEFELTNLLSSFRAQEEFELAVLGPRENVTQDSLFWGRRLFSISNRTLSLPLLEQAKIQWNWQEISNKQSLYYILGHPYAMWFYSLDATEDGPGIIVLWQLDEWHFLLKAFQQNMLGLLLIALLLTGATLGLLAWSPIRRLELYTRMLPLIAEQKFDEIRTKLGSGRVLVSDEVDEMGRAMMALTERQQVLESDVDSYTRELERLAMLDMLTGLPNKSMLIHELNKSIACVGRVHDKLALLFLDLDAFKRINDALGHNEGDELLKIIASRLGNSVRSMDTVFRQGGDEFLILLRGIRDEQDVRRVIHKIFASLQQPVVLGNHKLIVTTSIGVAMCDSPTTSAEELIKYADLAMYQAKDAGRSNFRVFTEDMLHKANNRLMVEQEIGSAISERQLMLFLQPIVSLDGSIIKGFEALIRWFHPSRGLIMPGSFIPHIEESDAIIKVGNYVLGEAVEMLKRLRLQGWDDLYIAVNLSARHYLTPGLSDFIRKLLTASGVPPSCLLLEVTEESVIEQVDKAMEVMRELKLLGVRIAIDDFGTGYSSLSYLKQLPFDVLKIDRCFTAGVLENGADTHIVTTVIDLAHHLGRTVVAEGIETELQREFLETAGCELAQGYLFSKPISEDKAMDILTGITEGREWPRSGDGELLGKMAG